ncbi:MAG TPA: 30S ribosomal protein S27ae [bacterium]|jgi:small subunit ribosomal protein S27Ae|uniref:Small ribosomal subunit protein eS31 n=7 Tax=Candidatus Marsarchaeota group 2 TaxID=2203771 RepID=A0A2R6CEY8_9ARCH|nr:MAG: 30S ribosomal protein S27ae [Candidatus Marsarchaeota G2 archaeon ECH_B_SAG-M15]PSN92674.1 MAG: 30S ribosomal protein S27ae [Candidatus Marsarchaeota G2 archaeon OSP_D]PSN96772.1 MAG: 30S ribosomal protein S27ae [Candidatus Marsarchaeota G2 archaeon ECH_B_2]PSN97454.1 MAG: 30S ribosomal protein S27ae [Candidatus Marsarchaeota G2 archaeon ECH_B_SAG-C16]PSO01341.1 MAG: 30S ribosomal protein S27ae [Candidatus Marsarchaeota G2 archaeon ECH_B_3]PSO03473.1 MAG: 30S ribosomal protein S27ae [C
MSDISKLYEYDYKNMSIKSLRKKCPRCGSNMAYHTVGGARWSCGKCGYTEFVKQKSNE